MVCTDRRALFALSLGLFVGASASVAASAVNWDDPPQGVFSDDWMIVELQGEKLGYAHMQMSRNGDVIETSNLMSLKVGRAGSAVPINILQSTKETLSGVVLEFSSRMDASAQALHKQGRVENGKVVISSNQFGVATTNEFDFPKGALMSWGVLRRQHEMGYKPGTTYVTQIFEPMFSENAGVPVEMKVEGEEEIEISGKTVKALRTTQAMLGMVTTTWMDDDENVLRTELPMMGMPMLMSRSTREKALAAFSPPEFFMPTTIPAPRKIDRANTRSVEYILRLKDRAAVMPELPTTAMQKPSDPDGSSVKLTVSRLEHAALAKAPVEKPTGDMAEFLASNALINSDDPAVQEMAKQARGDAKTPYEIADRLRKYVTDVIEDKNLSVGFATASEVCRNKQGDCSEHAVLLAALGRACGLPTRVVTGLVYVPVFGGSDDIFGFHMWTQFRLGDQWVDFDAAQRESDCNATHIAFSVSSLAGAGLGQIALDLINLIGNLEIDITAVHPVAGQASGTVPTRQ